MRGRLRREAAARGPRRRSLNCHEGPPGSVRNQGAPALSGQAGIPLGQDSLPAWVACRGPLAAGIQRRRPRKKSVLPLTR
jgi:hypothetical protein